MSGKNMGKRLTWEEIVEKYPHQNVGLVDCYPNSYNIQSAIVKYTEADTSYNDMIEKGLQIADGKISVEDVIKELNKKYGRT